MMHDSMYVMLNGYQTLKLLGRGVCSFDEVSGSSFSNSNTVNVFRDFKYFDDSPLASDLIDLKLIKVIGEISSDYFDKLNKDLLHYDDQFYSVPSIPLYFFRNLHFETSKDKESCFNSIYDNLNESYVTSVVSGPFLIGSLAKDVSNPFHVIQKEDYRNAFYSSPVLPSGKDSLLGSIKGLLVLGQEPSSGLSNQIPKVIVDLLTQDGEVNKIQSYINSGLLSFFCTETNPEGTDIDRIIFNFVAMKLFNTNKMERVLNTQIIIDSFEELPAGILNEKDSETLGVFLDYLEDLSIGEVGSKSNRTSINIGMHAILMLLKYENLDGLISNARKGGLDQEVLCLSVFLAGLFEGYENMSASYYKGELEEHKNFSLFSMAMDDEDLEVKVISKNNSSFISVANLIASEGFSLVSPHLESVASEFRSSNYVFKTLSENSMFHEFIFPNDVSRIKIYLKLIDDNSEKKHVFRVYINLGDFKKSIKKDLLLQLIEWNGKTSSRCKVALFENQWILCADQLVGTLDGDEVVGMIDDISDGYKQLKKFF